MKYQGLRQIYIITEWKDDCIYRTKSKGYAWITLGTIPIEKDTQYCSVSTSIMSKVKTNRTVSDDTPDIVQTNLKELGVE